MISLVTGGHINPPPGGLGGGLGGLLGRGGNQMYGGRGGGLGALLNRGGGPGGYDRGGRGMDGRSRSGDNMQTQQNANYDGQDYGQERTYGGFAGGREGGRRMGGGGLGLGSGPLGLPIPTPQNAIKKLLKKVHFPVTPDDKRIIHADDTVKDVLYLMIVNMPSEAEMAAAMATAEGQRR